MAKGEIQNGRIGVVEALYKQHGPSLLRYLRRIAGPKRAEDLLQDTFIQALSHVHKLDTVHSPKAWLFILARNTAINVLRRKKILYPTDWECISEQMPEEDPRLESMRRAISKLSEEHRETLLLRWYDQLTYEEIGQFLQIPVGTVRSRLHHALEKLRSSLEVEVLEE